VSVPSSNMYVPCARSRSNLDIGANTEIGDAIRESSVFPLGGASNSSQRSYKKQGEQGGSAHKIRPLDNAGWCKLDSRARRFANGDC